MKSVFSPYKNDCREDQRRSHEVQDMTESTVC